MSHVVHFWETPVPRSFGEAGSMLGSVEAQRGGDVGKLAALVEALGRIADAKAARDPSFGEPWVYELPKGRRDSALLSVQVRPHAFAVILNGVAAASRALGLTMFDDQAGLLCLPDGQILGPAGPTSLPAHAPEEPTELKSKRQVFALLHDALKPLMAPLGFRGSKKDASFVRETKAVRHQVGFGLVDRAPLFEVGIHASVEPVLAPPWRELGTKWGARCPLLIDAIAAAAGVLVPGDRPFVSTRYARVSDLAALDGLMAGYRELLSKAIVPFLDSCDTIAHLDRRANPGPGELRCIMSTYSCPIVAAVSGSGRVEQVVAECIQQAREDWIKNKYRDLLAQIRNVMVVD
jgi:hypothetical protein